jgi:hypothetical protein
LVRAVNFGAFFFLVVIGFNLIVVNKIKLLFHMIESTAQ